MYGLRAVIDRCGLLSGPWQFGKVDQGVITYWLLAHYFKRELAYIGFGGHGKQVRDLLHVEDLAELLDRQLSRPEIFDGRVYTIGGGMENSASLMECTRICQEVTGNRIPVTGDDQTRPGDIALFISDQREAAREFDWKPARGVRRIFGDVFEWVRANEDRVRGL
jgi:CDP-paratose 2-epimerase